MTYPLLNGPDVKVHLRFEVFWYWHMALIAEARDGLIEIEPGWHSRGLLLSSIFNDWIKIIVQVVVLNDGSHPRGGSADQLDVALDRLNERLGSLRGQKVLHGTVDAVRAFGLRVRLHFMERLPFLRRHRSSQRIEPTDERTIRMDAAALCRQKHARSVFRLFQRCPVCRRVAGQKLRGAHVEISRQPRDLIRVDMDDFVMTTATAGMAGIGERGGSRVSRISRSVGLRADWLIHRDSSTSPTMAQTMMASRSGKRHDHEFCLRKLILKPESGLLTLFSHLQSHSKILLQRAIEIRIQS